MRYPKPDWRALPAFTGLLAVGAAAADMSARTLPYGAWPSPLQAREIAAGGTRLGNVRVAGNAVYWTENVPAEGGRIALMRLSAGGQPELLAPKGSNVRTRVHEYGGAPYLVVGGRVVMSQYDDQRLYVRESGGERRVLTPPGYRYADCSLVPGTHGAPEFVCVREDHTDPAHVRNAIVRLRLDTPGAGEVLYDGSDFVAYPRVSGDGRRLAFIRWSHPNMPWDGTELVVAPLPATGAVKPLIVAGGVAEAVLDPQWGEDGALYFLSDRSDWWSLYSWAGGAVRPVWQPRGELGGPLWTLGDAHYALIGHGRAVARFGVGGIDRLAVVDLTSGQARELDLPYVRYGQLARRDAGHVVMLGAAADEPPVLLSLDVEHGRTQVLRQAGSARLEPRYVSRARPIEFASAGGRRSHAFYYAPLNPDCQAPAGTKPPVIAFVHGGPTSQATPDYDPSVQFWTTRGFAVVDVNYGGSSGYGRAYRQLLNGAWGVVDVEDVAAAVRYLGEQGLIDPAQAAISGGSAGGYTVLNALVTGSTFTAGADYYGISDMTALARDTHKFESRYLDSLIGPLPASQAIYEARSPLNHLDALRVPLIVLQGADDPVVPPNQSEMIVAALKARHAPVAYLLFPGEGHGFRRPENIARSLEAELTFYGLVYGFAPAGDLPPLPVDNLPAR